MYNYLSFWVAQVWKLEIFQKNLSFFFKKHIKSVCKKTNDAIKLIIGRKLEIEHPYDINSILDEYDH